MTCKIIALTGAHEGVGKTTLAVNLAARYAQTRRLPVLIIDTDPLYRGETSLVAGASAGITVLEVLDQLASKQSTLQTLRGRVPLNRMNIGVMSIGARGRPAERLTPDQWGFFLQAYSQLYDLVVDIELINPLSHATYDLADLTIWTLLPNLLSLKSTTLHLEGLQSQKFDLRKFLLIVNESGTECDLPDDSMNQALSPFDKAVDLKLPVEPELAHLLNQGRPAVLEKGRSAYYQGLTPILERIARAQRDETASFSSPVRATGVASGSGPAGSGNVAVLQTRVVDKMLEEKRKSWNNLKQRIHRELVDELNIRRIDLDTKGDLVRERQLRTNVESTVNGLISKEKEFISNREEREKLVKELVDEALGLGPLEELLTDPAITEIMVNRFDQVYIERRGKITLSDKRFIDNNHVIQVIRRIISPLGRRIDESIPMVDARLKDGSRVNAIIPPLAVQGPSLTIRRFPDKAFTAEDLIRMGAITRPMIDFLKAAVAMKKNMIISGGTGTGKTTILNLLSGFISNDDRIVTVEDTAELRMQQDHVVRLEARPANIEGQGQVSIRDLVKNCLRMRPDRIVVGECRGGEALDMLQAMNTGHEGSLTTIHANSPKDALTRLETLCLMAGMELPVWALREQIRSAVHIVVQLTRMQDGSRKVTCVTEVTGRDEEAIQTQDLFRYVQDGLDAQGHVLGHHEATGCVPLFYPELKSRGIELDATLFKAPDAPRPFLAS